MNENNKILQLYGKKLNFLLDTSAILYFQELYRHCGASIFKAMAECQDINFFVLNYVLSELLQGPKGLNPTQLGPLINHILNSEYSSDPKRKENRFLIEVNGETRYIVLNNISTTDYAQVLACQNHKELTLVSNDVKLLKSAAQVIKERRVVGIPAMLDRILFLYPKNKRIKVLKETGDKLFAKKHAFGNITEKQFNKKYKK
jgi:hypothetical protein